MVVVGGGNGGMVWSRSLRCGACAGSPTAATLPRLMPCSTSVAATRPPVPCRHDPNKPTRAPGCMAVTPRLAPSLRGGGSAGRPLARPLLVRGARGGSRGLRGLRGPSPLKALKGLKEPAAARLSLRRSLGKARPAQLSGLLRDSPDPAEDAPPLPRAPPPPDHTLLYREYSKPTPAGEPRSHASSPPHGTSRRPNPPGWSASGRMAPQRSRIVCRQAPRLTAARPATAHRGTPQPAPQATQTPPRVVYPATLRQPPRVSRFVRPGGSCATH